MAKKDDKPYMPFYIGDWFKAPEIRALPLQNRMVWFEILCIMWQSEEKGVLTINNAPFVITDDITGVITDGEQVLASMLGINTDLLQESFKLFKKFGVYKVRGDKAVYSGFMVKLIENKSVKSKAGKIGMEKRYSNSVITGDITNSESEITIIIKNLEKLEEVNTYTPEQKNLSVMIVLKMIEVFKKENPQYPIDKEEDYSACLQIAYKIADGKSWKHYDVLNGKMPEALESWKTIVKFIKKDGWLTTRTLTDLSRTNEWKRLVQKMAAEKNAPNHSQPKIKV